ncbi:MAG: DUF5667 domain-containing protein [Candidatus Nanohaloarchaea archaeon]|nr:DUF5667 domain-containing protein [Candidatus Nanohaloarchaea archaeon]
MNRAVVVFSAILVMLSPMALASGHSKLVGAGTTPGSFLSGLDRAAESISLAITFSPEGKARKKLQFAEERLSEAEELAERGEEELANDTAEEYSKEVEEARSYGKAVAEAAKKGKIDQVVSRATSIHMEVLAEKLPGEVGYRAKRKAEEVTVETENDTVEKARKQAMVARNRANESKALAERRPEKAAKIAKKYRKEVGELRGIVNRTSEGKRAEVQEIVAKATQKHQKVLQRVYEQVPEQAKDAIKRAMERSSKGHKRAVEALKKRGQMPEGVKDKIPAVPEGKPSAPGKSGKPAKGGEDDSSDAVNNTQKEDQDSRRSQKPAVEVVTGPAGQTVAMENTKFQSSPTVSPGAVVKFENIDSYSHTVTIEAEGVDKSVGGGQSINLKFNKEGTYKVVCTIHAGMETTVTVKKGGTGQPGSQKGSQGGSGGSS